MSALFNSFNLGRLAVKNRFICSACEDNYDTATGEVTERAIRKVDALSDGEVGLIITAHMFVHALGKTRAGQMGIHCHAMIPGLQRLVESAHRHEGKIVFQLGHAGQQAGAKIIGRAPLGPSAAIPMSGDEIREVIEAFVMAARRAVEAGADGVQVHAAHGYLINEFLSPYYNRREDSWGGSEENRFRMLKEIVEGIRSAVPSRMALLLKLNAEDYTPSEGITLPLAQRYAERLVGRGVDGLEISCGTTLLSTWNMCRGSIPIPEILLCLPEDQRKRVESILMSKQGHYDCYEAYNLEAAKKIRPFAKDITVIPVGGWRRVLTMEKAIENAETDFISMCRPFIKEPSLVRDIRRGVITKSSCTSCNRCGAALGNSMPVQCYVNGFPVGKPALD